MTASARADDLAEVPITLAPMRRRHLHTVLAHERAVYARPWTMGLFLSELARPESRSYVVARAGALVVGHSGVMFIGDEGHLTTVVVAPKWQRHHIATRMLAYQFRHAVDRGVDALTLEVRVANAGARSLYQRFGFVPAGIRKGYYAETGEDALIMWAHDLGSPSMRERLEVVSATLAGPTRLDNLAVSDDDVAGADGPGTGGPATDDQCGAVDPADDRKGYL